MKILSANKMENCIDGDFVIKFTFDNTWTKEAILALGALGRLKYYGSFPRPMFQLTCSDGTFVKGVQGTAECRVIYTRDRSDEAVKQFETRFDKTIHSF